MLSGKQLAALQGGRAAGLDSMADRVKAEAAGNELRELQQTVKLEREQRATEQTLWRAQLRQAEMERRAALETAAVQSEAARESARLLQTTARQRDMAAAQAAAARHVT